MEKINVAELLKDCPSGMELDCTMFIHPVTFDKVINYVNENYPIVIKTHNGSIMTLTKHGTYTDAMGDAKCVIYPKGKTTWDGFVPPIEFKDGDILATDLGSVFYLNTRLNTDECYGCYVGIGGDGSFHICEPFAYKECCGLAYEEEKQKLFKAIKDYGYKWNSETKTLEKLIEPKFKVGDRIKNKNSGICDKVIKIFEDCYLVESCLDEQATIGFDIQDNWVLAPNKFDISTLKPFDKVLVRDSYKNMWRASIFSHTWKDKYFCIGAWYNQCIPYEANKELLGTTNDCGWFYKNWEEE